jgi:hypothetical protein
LVPDQIRVIFRGITGKLNFLTIIHTVTKAKHDAGAQHKGDGKFRHPHRSVGKIRQQHSSGRSSYMIAGIFRHPCFCSCVTHGFF